MNHKMRQNIVIYGSLILAIILLVFAAKDYYGSKGSEEPVLKELNEILNSKNNNITDDKHNQYEKEPNDIKDVDKVSVINKYLDDILNRRINDDLLKYDVLITWDKYEIINMMYIKKITENYYAYNISVKIPNKDAKLAGKKNNKLSTNEYVVVDIEFDLLISGDQVVVKNVNG